VLYANALVFGAPISTTHTITSAIMGVGATRRVSAVRWGVAGNIVTAWVLTFPGAALIAIVAHFLIAPFTG
jgi:PiT family inorganic phosphate transporter